MRPTLTMTDMEPADWVHVHAIYAQGLVTGIAAFRQKPPLWRDWDAGHLKCGRLVARRGDDILGWAALAPVADS